MLSCTSHVDRLPIRNWNIGDKSNGKSTYLVDRLPIRNWNSNREFGKVLCSVCW